MSVQYPAVDPEGLLEYSVVFTDRALNHMSHVFQQVMRDISSTLKQVYQADAIAVIPGGGSFGMEGCCSATGHRAKMPNPAQRLVQLSLDADFGYRAHRLGQPCSESSPRECRPTSRLHPCPH
jgi:hypothetical protein